MCIGMCHKYAHNMDTYLYMCKYTHTFTYASSYKSITITSIRGQQICRHLRISCYQQEIFGLNKKCHCFHYQINYLCRITTVQHQVNKVVS